MLDLKCAVQAQLDTLWLKPDDLAHGLDVRVASVRNWLDPMAPQLPPKDVFTWLEAQSTNLETLVNERLRDAQVSHSKFGIHILRWYRVSDLLTYEPLGLHNLASRLAGERFDQSDVDYSIVYAMRDDSWIERNLDEAPDIDLKATFAAETETLGITRAKLASALDISPDSVKYWKNPNREDMYPVDDAWNFIDEYATMIDERTKQFMDQRPNPLPYHPLTRKGALTQQERIENRAAIEAARRIYAIDGIVSGFAYV